MQGVQAEDGRVERRSPARKPSVDDLKVFTGVVWNAREVMTTMADTAMAPKAISRRARFLPITALGGTRVFRPLVNSLVI